MQSTISCACLGAPPWTALIAARIALCRAGLEQADDSTQYAATAADMSLRRCFAIGKDPMARQRIFPASSLSFRTRRHTHVNQEEMREAGPGR